MSLQNHFALMAGYNRWMNEKLYDAAARMDESELRADKGAFFGSVIDTLGHILRADTLWLKHFVGHPSAFRSLAPVRVLPHPYTLPDMPHREWSALCGARRAMDEVIVALCAEISEADCERALTYRNRAGEIFVRRFGHLLQHFFNHQTHHRGQVTTLLSQSGIDVGTTDLSAMLPEYG